MPSEARLRLVTEFQMTSSDLPAKKLTRFLHAYGPEDSNTNLYDEWVATNALRYDIEPLELDAEYVGEIVNLLRKSDPHHALVAGVAGDGKSYHLRQIWKELGGDPETWRESGDLKLEYFLDNGQKRTAFFIKDLSADLTDFRQAIWPILRSSSPQTELSLVMACNHGQILSKLRMLCEEEGEEEAGRFADELEDFFFNKKEDNRLGDSFERVYVYDLSRPSQADRLKKIIRMIAMHPNWASCSACECRGYCFIQKNLDALWDRSADKPTIAAQRLCSLVELAALNGSHFPIRELFMLAVNAGFGTTSNRPGKLLGTCDFVKAKRDNPKRADMDVFINILGDNLPASIFSKKRLFRQLAQFEVGAFGNPFFDHLILLGNENPNLQKKYFDKSLKQDKKPSSKELVEARRRLFFLWDESAPKSDAILHEEDLWSLTAYPHANDYLELVREMRVDDDDQGIPSELIQGLNRIMTGSATCDSTKVIRVATNGADARDPVGMLVVSEIFADKTSRHCEAFMTRSACSNDAVPQLEFQIGDGEDASIRFDLTPRRYEFLIELASGALPTSFSKQIQFEFYALKSLLVRAALEGASGRKFGSKVKELKFNLVDEQSSITIKLPENFSHE